MMHRCQRQRGVAAIEFAAVLMVLLLLVYGIVSFGAVLYAQQAVVRAAEDGARSVATLPNGPTPDIGQISSVVYDSLAQSLVVPVASNSNLSARRIWVAANVQVSVTSAVTTGVTVSVRYNYSSNRLLPSIPLLDTSSWVPDTLTGRAVIAQPT
jgi:Flp pilus assembly protein TadG